MAVLITLLFASDKRLHCLVIYRPSRRGGGGVEQGAGCGGPVGKLPVAGWDVAILQSPRRAGGCPATARPPAYLVSRSAIGEISCIGLHDSKCS